MTAVYLIFIAIVFSSTASCCSTEQKVVAVSSFCASPSHSNYTDLDTALSNLCPNTILSLEAGKHVLSKYHGSSLRNITNISLIGDTEKTVRVMCQEPSKTGLVFINVTNLVIKGITFDGCGLTNTSLHDINEILRTFIHVHFRVPTSIRVGLFLAHCVNVVMTNCLVTNTKGIGMLGINIIGNSNFSNVNFSYNIRPHCSNKLLDNPLQYYTSCSDDCGEIGGGAYLVYEDLEKGVHVVSDSSLVIDECTFEHNADCSYAGYTNLAYQYYTSVSGSTYTVGGGGGLTVFMAQTQYPTEVTVSRSKFFKNDALRGAGAHIGLFAGFVNNVVTFSNCTFEANGLPSADGEYIDKSFADGGAGVAVFTDLLRHSDISKSPSFVFCINCKNVSFTAGTTFVDNAAMSEGGGLLCYSLSVNVHLHNSVEYLLFNNVNFSNNSAQYGSGLRIFQKVTAPVDGVMIVGLSNVLVEKGKKKCVLSNTTNTCRMDISAVDFSGINVVVLNGNLTIQGNEGSGLHLESSGVILKPDTSLIVQGNKAHRGGGILMKGTAPGILMAGLSSLILRNNTAIAEGGAIYYSSLTEQKDLLEPLNHHIGCFIFTAAYAYSSSCASICNITVEFIDNHAPVGSMVFGASLNTCSWAKELNVNDSNLYFELYNIPRCGFKFSDAPQGKKFVSSFAHSIVVNESIASIPGQKSTVNVSVQDMFGNEIDTVLSTECGEDENQDYEVLLGPEAVSYHVNRSPFELQTKGRSDGNRTHCIWTQLCSTDNLVSTNVTIEILDCPIGFTYDDNISQCICAIPNNLVKCVSQDGELQLWVPREKWLGFIHGSSSSMDDLVLLDCYFGHCSTKESLFDALNTDNQCANESHRSGVRCSQCEKGYSAVKGDFMCEKCSDKYLWFFLVFFVVAILNLLILAFLSSTTDNSFTYMVIFFSNIVFPYTIYERHVMKDVKYIISPARWPGLELGINVCFYSGLTPLQGVALRFFYPGYLYCLMALLALLWRCSPFVRRHFSLLKTVAALIVFTYTEVFKTGFFVLGATVAKNLNNESRGTRWIIDPSQAYFQGLHALLASFVCILVVVYLIPLPIFLFSYKLGYKYKKLKPILDAFLEPYKPKFYFWAGVRLVFQTFIASYPVYLNPSNIWVAHFGIVLTILISFLYLQSLIKPFKDNVINVCDSFLILVAAFMHKFVYYVTSRILAFQDTFDLDKFLLACVSIILGSAYLIILLTFLWYFQPTVKKLMMKLKCTKHTTIDIRTQTIFRNRFKNRPTHTSVSVIPHDQPLFNNESLRYFAD